MLQYCFKMLCLSKCNSFGPWKQHITSSPTLSRNIRPKSSRLAEPLWTDPGLKSGISVRENTPLPKTQTHRNTDTDTDTQTQTHRHRHTHTHTHTHTQTPEDKTETNKRRRRRMVEHSPKILASEEKSTTTMLVGNTVLNTFGLNSKTF